MWLLALLAVGLIGFEVVHRAATNPTANQVTTLELGKRYILIVSVTAQNATPQMILNTLAGLAIPNGPFLFTGIPTFDHQITTGSGGQVWLVPAQYTQAPQAPFLQMGTVAANGNLGLPAVQPGVFSIDGALLQQ